MKITQTQIDGLLIIEPPVFGDPRGYFMETYQQTRYADCGVPGPFVQDNLAFSTRGILRGLHFQIKHPQSKLVQVIKGEVFDVAVDIRPDSPTFGRWDGALLSEKNKRQLFVPPGCAHGYCVVSDEAYLTYKCGAYYHPEDEGGILWNDPDLGIDWPVTEPALSDKDRNHPQLKDLPPNKLFAPEKTS